MRILSGAFIVLFLLVPGLLSAGAWPRERGTWFLSSDVRLAWPQDTSQWVSLQPASNYYTIYAEYGLPRNLTLGLDLGHSVSGAGKTVAFLRMPLPKFRRGPELSAEFGLGVIDGRMVARPGISAGLGFATFGTPSWLAADAVVEVVSQPSAADLKLDLTYGVTLENGMKVILQLQSGLPASDPSFARLAPSIALPVGKNRLAEFGVTYGLRGDDSMGIKLGVWQTF